MTGWRLTHSGHRDEWSTGCPLRLCPGTAGGQQLLSEPHVGGESPLTAPVTLPALDSISTVSEPVPCLLGPHWLSSSNSPRDSCCSRSQPFSEEHAYGSRAHTVTYTTSCLLPGAALGPNPGDMCCGLKQRCLRSSGNWPSGA